MTTLYDNHGNAISLGKLIGTGGEADVFEVGGRPNFVAKKYFRSLSAVDQNKLRAMCSFSNPDVHKVAAWPTNTLHDRPNGKICGWVMRNVPGKDIHILYSPAHRKAVFPHANWKFLIYAAMNCAAAFDVVHKHGIIVGDVNQSNVLVNDDALVTLIDCDSFQMQMNGQFFPCEVGQLLYTPPELQSRSLSGIQRTANHDRFGLALLIFHLLFMGRHPYSGRFLGKGDMPIEKAIQENRFAYGKNAAAYQMGIPLHSLTFTDIPSDIGMLFEKAFAPGATRPSALDWFSALKSMAGVIKECSADRGHVFFGLRCPWCVLMLGGAPNFFIPPLPGGIVVFHLSQVWGKIEDVPRPNNVYTVLQPIQPSIATSWPFSLAAPVEPVALVILLSSCPTFAPLRLAPPKFQQVTIQPDSLQNFIGLAAVGFLIACPILAMLGAGLGVLGMGNPWVNSIVVGLSFLCVGIGFGIWWAALESNRRREKVEANEDFNQEQRERKKSERQHQEKCKREWKEQQNAARRKYDEERKAWNVAILPYKKEAERRREMLRAASKHLAEAEQAWTSYSSSAISAFERKKADLAIVKARYDQIESQRSLEWQQLQARAREIQKRDFLETYFIYKATLPNIGPGRKATLASFGIETAGDIEASRVYEVPGFGPKLIETLVAWRLEVEGKFNFNPTAGVPKTEKQMFDSKFQQLLLPLQQTLLNGESELAEMTRSANVNLERLCEQIRAYVRDCYQARADVSVIPTGL